MDLACSRSFLSLTRTPPLPTLSPEGERASSFCPRQQIDQLLAPELGPGVGAVAARVAGRADQDVAAGLEAPGGILGDAVFVRIDEIVARIDPGHRDPDPLEPRPGIVGARGFELVDEV